MFISNFSKANPLREIQIDSAIQKLYFEILIPEVFGGQVNPMQYIYDEMQNLKISISRQTKNGSEPLILPISLLDVSEICSNSTGHIEVLSFSGQGNSKVDCTVDLSFMGSLQLSEGFLLLTLDTSTTQNITGSVYGLESETKTDVYNEFVQSKVNADTLKSISLVDKVMLSLPKKGFQQIDIVFPTHTVSYKNDLKAVTRAHGVVTGNFVFVNDSQMETPIIHAQTYIGGTKYYTIPVTDAIEAKILYSEDTKVVTVGMKRA